MTDEHFVTMSELDWTDIRNYQRWLEENCGLVEVSGDAIWSMRVSGQTGLQGLLSKKTKVEKVLRENIERIDALVEEIETDLSSEAIIAVIRENINVYLELLAEQIGRLERIVEHSQLVNELVYVPISEDEIPF